VFSECRKCYFRDPNFKNFLGAYAPGSTPLANSCLRYSAHTFTGDRAYYPGGGGGARKMGPLAILPYHWRILKKCTAGWFKIAQLSKLLHTRVHKAKFMHLFNHNNSNMIYQQFDFNSQGSKIFYA
jgi:hypothetical protein